MKKFFILDTNVLIHDSEALFAFSNSIIILPLVVLEELDRFKSDRTEMGRNAREVSRRIDAARHHGSLEEGVDLSLIEPGAKGSVLKIVRTPESVVAGNMGVAKDLADNKILLTAKYFSNQGLDVTFISKDVNARIKANVLGVVAEDYRKGIIRGDAFFKGFVELFADDDSVKKFDARKLESMIGGKTLYPNQYFVVWLDKPSGRYKLFKNSPIEGLVDVSRISDLWSFRPKNPGQHMALDLLCDDMVNLVCLIGPAGTGKTFLTLLAGLEKVIIEKYYSRLFVARPLVSLGADIGFIPGDLQEKLFHWMHPIYDNLEYIFGQMRMRNELGLIFDHISPKSYNNNSHGERNGRHRDRAGKHRFEPNASIDQTLSSYNPGVHDTVERLQRKGLLGLEAITYMRGRSIPRQFMFIDEAQNLTAQEIKTIISRAGDGTKVVLSGDPYQIDSPLLDFYSNGLTITSERLKKESIVGTVVLENSERSALAKLATEKL